MDAVVMEKWMFERRDVRWEIFFCWRDSIVVMWPGLLMTLQNQMASQAVGDSAGQRCKMGDSDQVLESAQQTRRLSHTMQRRANSASREVLLALHDTVLVAVSRPTKKPCTSSVLSRPLSTAFGALQLSSVGIEEEITCE